MIDGQQRLTSISLILIFLHNIQKQSIHRRVNVSELIFSERFGEKSFNIDVEERTPCMEALFNEHHLDFEGSSSESVRTIELVMKILNIISQMIYKVMRYLTLSIG